MAELRFENGFNGTYEVRGQTLKIGYDAIQPYDMTYGAIASCLFSTYYGLAKERGIEIKEAKVSAEGRKRTSVPSTIEYLKIRICPVSEAEPAQLEALLEEALQKCSMVATFRHVAEIDAALSFAGDPQ